MYGSTNSASPTRRAWQRFRRNRLGFVSLVPFCALVVLSLFAEIISNDKPLVVRYNGSYYLPLVTDYPETTFGGDFQTATDYLDPFIREQLRKDGNWAIYPPTPTAPKPSTTSPNRPTRPRPRWTTCWARTTAAAICWRS